MERLTSVQNPLIKELSRLADRKGRLESGCFLAEGVRLVGEALASGAPVVRLLADDAGWPALEAMLALHPGPEPIRVTSEILAKLSDTRSPQGIIAVVRLRESALGRTGGAGWLAGRPRRILALERVQDPGNVGTMIRTADACGFDRVVLSADSADPWQPKVLRATMGSIWHVDPVIVPDLVEAAAAVRETGVRILAAHPRNAAPCWETDLADGVMVVIGNEANGLSEAMLALADRAVMVPMAGRAESLNAASAASMLLYESLRQRSGR